MTESLLVTQLRSLRHQCLGLAHTIESVLAVVDAPPAMEESAEEMPPCEHPVTFRVPAATMGHPTRFRCNACGEEVDV